jgi:hypothetical protein
VAKAERVYELVCDENPERLRAWLHLPRPYPLLGRPGAETCRQPRGSQSSMSRLRLPPRLGSAKVIATW